MLPRVNAISTELGNFLLFATQDFISQSLYRQGTWEPWNLQISSILLEGLKTPTIVDVGANLGAYAIPMARSIMAAKGQVVAFEAQRTVYYQLCGNIFLNRLDNCIAHHLAIGEHSGAIDIPTPDYASEFNIGALSMDRDIRAQQRMMSTLGTTSLSERVTVTTLDSFELSNVSLLKIDAEGMEREVIQGARETLKTNRFPPILFESWTAEQAPWFQAKRQATLDLIESIGYSWALIDSVGIAQHQGSTRFFDVIRAGDGTMRLERRN